MSNKIINNLDGLVSNNLINEKEKKSLKPVADLFSIALTNEMKALIDTNNIDDPIKKQFIPTEEELHILPVELEDPIGDSTHSPVKGITHRYPDRCLLSVIQICAVYCRFCFRRENVGPNNDLLTQNELDKAYNYIKSNPEIWEVILTGGDPLIMKPKSLNKVMSELSMIDSVKIIRFHTRIPVVQPTKITDELIKTLKVNNKTTYIILHINHVKELTEASKNAISRLVDAGIPLLSQTVLLNGINNNIDALSDLMKELIINRVKPYYLHHGDLAKGTKHFRTSVKEGQTLMKQLRGRFSGLCQPTYVLDIPDGYGKVPINHNYICEKFSNQYNVEDYKGVTHEYSSFLDESNSDK